MTTAIRALVLLFLLAATATAQSPGAIVAVGGGGTTDAIVARTLELAGGKNAVVAVLPQFVNFHAGAISVQMMVLGFVFILIAFVCDAVWALLASSAASWFARSPRRLAAVRGTGGAA